MASIPALAAAIRDRLLAEEPAPLPGFGVLRRVHVPARVETRPDGSRTLQPPRESLRLVIGQEQDPGPLALALARELGLPVSQGRDALLKHVEQVEALVAARGEVELEGVGIVRRTDGGLLFGADPGFLATINASFHGLTSVGTTPEAPPPPEMVDAPDPVDSEAIPPSQSTADPVAPNVASGDGAGAASGDGYAPLIAVPSEQNAEHRPVFGEAPLESESPTPSGSIDSDADAKDVSADAATDLSLPPDPFRSLSDDDGAADLRATSIEPIEELHQPTNDVEDAPVAKALGERDTNSEEDDANPLESYFLDSPEADAPSANDALNADEQKALADAAVDDLLAGIWTSGTPSPSSLGVDPHLIEEAEYDLVDASDADSPSESASGFLAAEPSAAASAASGAEDTPETTAGVGRPFEPVRQPAGLPTMPAGWTPTITGVDEEYETDPYDEPRKGFPWAILGAVAALALLAVAALVIWPRFQSASSTEITQPETAAVTPDLSPADAREVAGLDTTEAIGMIDSAAVAADAAQFLIEPGVTDADGPADVTLDPGTRSAGGRTRGELSRPSPEALAAAAAEIDPARATRQRTPEASPPPSNGSVSAPDVAGLPASLADALTSSAPIRLDATGFTWVVSSTSNRAEANRAAQRYAAAGFRSRVIEGVVDGRPMYRIAVGQFDTREDAYRVRDLLPSDVRGRNDIWTLNLADV